jgi:hypothetical protein
MTRQKLLGPAGAVLLLAGATAWFSRPDPVPPGVNPEVARCVRQLSARPGRLRQLTEQLAQQAHRNLARRLPEFLRTDPIERRRVEACHRLLTRGAEVWPVAPRLMAICVGRDATAAFYAYLVIAYSGLPAADFVAQARAKPADLAAVVRLSRGLLATEDEPLRDYAWACLEAAGPAANAAVPRLRELVAGGDPVLHRRAQALLARREAAPAPAAPAPTGAAPERLPP